MNSTDYNFSNINYSLEAYIYIHIHTHISVKLTSGLLFGKKKENEWSSGVFSYYGILWTIGATDQWHMNKLHKSISDGRYCHIL